MRKRSILLVLLLTLAVSLAIPARGQLPSSHILVSCFLDEVLTVVDARNIRVVNKISVPQITDLAISPNNQFLVASIFNRDYMPVFSVPSLRMGTTARGEHLKAIKAMAFSRDGARLYVLNEEDAVLHELHVPSFKIIRSLKLNYYKPSSMVLTKDRTKMYVIHPSMGRISVVDLLQWENVGDINLRDPIGGMALTPDEKSMCVTFPEQHLMNIYDVATQNAVGSAPVENGACQVKINDQGVAVVLNSVSNTISIINVKKPLDRRIVQVGNGPRDVLMMPGSMGCFVANYTSGDLSVIDLNTIHQLGRLPVGRGACCLSWMN